MKFNRKVLGIFLSLGCFLTFGVVASAKGESKIKTQKEEFGGVETNPVRRFGIGLNLKNYSKKNLTSQDVTKVFVAFYSKFNEILKKYNLEKLGFGEKSLLFFMMMNESKNINIENLNKELENFSFEFFKGNRKLDSDFEKFVNILKSGKANEIKITESGFSRNLNNIKTSLESYLNGLKELHNVLREYVGKKEISDDTYKKVGMKIFDINMETQKEDVKILRERVKKNSLAFKEVVENILSEENIKYIDEKINVIKGILGNIKSVRFDEILKISENIDFGENLKDITKKYLGSSEQEKELKFKNLLCLIDPKEKMNFCGVTV